MISQLKWGVQRVANRLGYKIERLDTPPPPRPVELDPQYAEILRRTAPFSMTGCERIAGLVDAVRYVSKSKIAGALVECGVWRGGSMMAAALALLESGEERDLYLFDTFAGMTEPSERDLDYTGGKAEETYRSSLVDGRSDWCYASLDDVRANLASTGYPAQMCHFVKGDVLETIPAGAPAEIAILRLDTDWYESTRHELAHLFPRLAPGGILIVDDYGHWSGSRQAVDEYFGEQPPFMFSVDYSCRVIVKDSAGPHAARKAETRPRLSSAGMSGGA